MTTRAGPFPCRGKSRHVYIPFTPAPGRGRGSYRALTFATQICPSMDLASWSAASFASFEVA